MNKTKRRLEIACVLMIWIIIPINQNHIVEWCFSVLPDRWVDKYILSDVDIFVYLLCFLAILILFCGFHGVKENLFHERRLRCLEIKQSLLILLTYCVLVIISIHIYKVEFEADYLARLIFVNLAIVALSKEISFRRLVLCQLLSLRIKNAYAILLCGAIFMAVHILVYLYQFESWSNINLAILLIKIGCLLIMGILLSVVYLQYRNIIPAVLIHGGQNIIAQLIYMDERKGLVLYAIGFIVAVIFVIYHPSWRNIRGSRTAKKRLTK